MHITFTGGYRKTARIFELVSYAIGCNSISAKADIDNYVHFEHRGIGCVIHEGVKIGSNSWIYQNVTMGSKWSKGIRDYGAPHIGKNVLVGAGAVILGSVTIGDNCVIGANAVVIEDVPPNSLAVGVPVKIRSRK